MGPGYKRRTAAVLMILVAVSAWSADVPRLRGRINDYAGVLSSGTAAELEQYLAAVEQQSGAQIALLTVDSLEGDSLEAYSLAVVEEWQLGRAGEDNGVLLLVALAEKKIRIEVGYGLEGVLTDAASGYIIREAISPELRRGDFDAGISAGLTTIGKVVAGEVTISETQASRSEDSHESGMSGLFFFLFVLIFVIGRIGRMGRYRRRGMSPWGAFFLGSMLGGSTRGRSSGGFGGGGFGGFSGGGRGFGGGGASGGW